MILIINIEYNLIQSSINSGKNITPFFYLLYFNSRFPYIHSYIPQLNMYLHNTKKLNIFSDFS